MSNYRILTDKEIATLAVYGCSAENWKNILVVDDFSPNFFSNVHFSGNVKLGKFDKIYELPGGVKKHSGVFNCHLHNCELGNDVFIDKVNNYIANIEIGDEVYIENIDLILTDGESSFGNGVKVATMIESGGREVMIFDKLSAPIAYMMAFYKYENAFNLSITTSIEDYCKSKSSDKGLIAKGTKIKNCGTLRNVRIGECSVLEGVDLLDNGSVVSSDSAPVFIGQGVQCKNFIIQSGSTVTEAAMISNCFVGQGCLIGKQFSALDSLFFANCQGLHGEAVSIFAGPYTVTHHKSTLMLTAYYSFMNAGSGTNFSNHMYKLGPVHQGVTERGVKTSSNSYIMWPAKIGAFSVVLGRHKGNPDLSDLPFSYLIENEGESSLMPGINLHSAGTIRDVEKWPKRDLRTDLIKLDPICFDFLSPYTISKVRKGIDILTGLLQAMQDGVAFVWYQNCKIKRSAIKKGIELYEMAIDAFLSDSITNQLDSATIVTQDNISLFLSQSTIGIGEWVDMAGLFAPKSEVKKLISSVESANVDIDFIQNKCVEMFDNYLEYSKTYAIDIIESKLGKKAQEISPEDLNIIIERGQNAKRLFDDLILRDAKKEFNTISKVGFGMDGDDSDKNLDFIATRGTFEEHPFVKERSK